MEALKRHVVMKKKGRKMIYFNAFAFSHKSNAFPNKLSIYSQRTEVLRVNAKFVGGTKNICERTQNHFSSLLLYRAE